MCAVIFPFIRRLLSSFVLVCFTFTMFFPSWAWTMEDVQKAHHSVHSISTSSTSFLKSEDHLELEEDDQSIKDLLASPSTDDENARTWHRFLEKIIGQDKTTSSFLFGIGIDTSDILLSDKTANAHQFALPTDFSFSSIQTVLSAQSEIQPHYKGLSLTSSGLTWQTNGYEFILDFAGDLTFYAQNRSVADYAYTESLRVNNPYGDIYIGADVPSHRLQVSAHNIFYQTPSSPLERLDIWAFGVGDTKGIGCISAASHLKTREIYQHKGTFFQNGTLQNDKTFTLVLNEGGTNNGTITSSGVMNVTLNGTFVNNKTITSAQNMTLNGLGELQNHDLISTRGTLSGTLQSLLNSEKGTLSTAAGFSNFYVKKLINEGILSGSGSIRVGTGYNRNILTSESLQLQVDEEFTHEEGARLKADKQLTFEGTGLVTHKGMIETPRLEIASKNYEKASEHADNDIKKIILKKENDTFTIHEDATLTVDDFETKENPKSRIINKGDFTTRKSFVNSRSFTNGGAFSAHGFSHTGAPIVNNVGGDIAITGEAAFNTDTVENEGTWTFESALTGIVREFTNKKKGTLHFKKDVELIGTLAHNQGTLIAKSVLKWSVLDFKNDNRLFVYNNQIAASRQFYNTGFARWTHNRFLAAHQLNTGYLERTPLFLTTEASQPKFKSVEDVNAAFKPNSFVNFGTYNVADTENWLITVKAGTESHIVNNGTLNFDKGTVKYTHSIINNGLITANGALTLESAHVKNSVTIVGKDSLTIKSTHFDGSGGRVLGEKTLHLQVDKMTTNAKTELESDTSIEINTKDEFVNHGIIRGAKTTILRGGKAINYGTITSADLSFYNRVENRGTLHGSETMTLFAMNETNLGKIAGGTLVFKHKIRNLGTIHGTKTITFSSGETTNSKTGKILSPRLFFHGDIDNAGEIKGSRLDHYGQSKLTNKNDAKMSVNNYTIDQKLREISNSGHLVIGATHRFNASLLTNLDLFSIQSGFYEIDQINNYASGEINWKCASVLKKKDMTNDGILTSSSDFIIKNMHTVKKLGKVFCGGKLIIETTSKTVDPSHFITHALPNWQMKQLEIKGERFNLQHRFVSPVPLIINVTNFTNQNLLHSPTLTIHAKTFQNGISQALFGTIKSENDIDITVEESLDNRFGKINAGILTPSDFKMNGQTTARITAEKTRLRGKLTAKSLKGSVVNGNALGSGNGYYIMNGAYMSAGRSISLDAKEDVQNDFGELISDDVMFLKAGRRIINTAGRISAVGNMTWDALDGEITRNGGSIRRNVNFNDANFWYDQWQDYPTSNEAFVSAGGYIHFKVNNLTIRGSQVTSFGRIYDKNSIERTKTSPGDFRLESCVYYRHAKHHRHGSMGPAEVRDTLPSSLSSASEVDFSFANNMIAGAVIAAANFKMRGDKLTLGYTDTSIDSSTNQLSRAGRHSLANAINVLTGGAVYKQSVTENPMAVIGTGHSSIPGVAPRKVVTTFENILKSAEQNPELNRQLFDFSTLCWALQSTLLRHLNKGYLFAHMGLQEHLDKLTEAAIALSGNTMRLSLEQAENADKPLLTFTQKLMNGERILIPYITIPEAYINGDLAYNTGIVAEGRNVGDAIDIEMNTALDQFSSLISGANRVKLHSKGTRRSETLKHAVHFQDRKSSGYKEIARPQSIVKAGGELLDTSIGNFRSVGTARKAGGHAVVRSLEGNMTDLPLTLTQSLTTTTGGAGLFDGTERTVTEISQTGFIQGSIIAGEAILTGAGAKSHYSTVAPQHIAARDIKYTGKTGSIAAQVGVNSISTTAEGAFRSTSTQSETATVHPALSLAGGNVIYDFKDSVHVTGAIISATDLIDLTPVTFFGPSIGQVREERSVKASTGVGMVSRSVESGQDVVVPTMIMLSGTFISKPADEQKIGSKLVLKAVELSAPGGTEIFKQHFVEESCETKSWHHETSSKSGLSSTIVDIVTSHNPVKATVDAAIQSTVVGSIQSFSAAEGDLAKGIGALKVANSAVADAKLAIKAISTPGAAAIEFLARFTSINLGSSSLTSQMESYENLPTRIKTTWFHFDGLIWNHDDGAKLEATTVFVPNAETITMKSGVHRMTASTTSESASVTVNPLAISMAAANPSMLAAAGGVNIGNQTTTITQNIHDHASILADYVFIRSKNMLVTGATVRSRVIDVMVEDDLLLESVVDEITQTQEGVSVGLSTAMVTGEGALGKVAGLGDMAFSDNESKRRWIEQKTALIATEHLYLTVGKNFITRSAFAKREGATKTPDYYAVDDSGQSLALYEREMLGKSENSAFFALNLHGRTEAEELLKKQNIELPEGGPTTDTLDALATIQGIDLKIYEQDTTDRGKLVLVHSFKGSDPSNPTAINLVHVASDPRRPGVLNHFNRLENTQDFTKSTNRVEEHFEEEYGAVVTKEGYDISLPFATVATFAGNVYDFCHYVMEQDATFDPKSTVAETLTAPGVDVSFNPETVERIRNNVVDALRENGATESDIQTILSDPGMTSLIQGGANFNTFFEANKSFGIDIILRNPDGTRRVDSPFGNVLEKGLKVMCSAAATLSEFNDAHPTLTNLAILSVQTALSGPTQFVKSYALERSGIQGAIDQQVDAGTAWINDKLVNQLSMDAFYADILTEGGKFGFVIGAGMLGAGSKDKIIDSAKGAAEKLKMLKNPGRAGKQARLRELRNDDKLGSADRGWLTQDFNQMQRGKRETLRVPHGKELAHKRGFESAKGYDYSYTVLQDKKLHKLQHKHDGMGKKNKAATEKSITQGEKS